MAAKRYSDLLSPFVLTLTKGDIVLAQARVDALDEDDALSDGINLRREAGLSMFDATVKVTAEKLNANRF